MCVFRKTAIVTTEVADDLTGSASNVAIIEKIGNLEG